MHEALHTEQGGKSEGKRVGKSADFVTSNERVKNILTGIAASKGEGVLYCTNTASS